MKKFKLIALLLCLVMVVSAFVACGDDSSSSNGKDNDKTSASDKNDKNDEKDENDEAAPSATIDDSDTTETPVNDNEPATIVGKWEKDIGDIFTAEMGDASEYYKDISIPMILEFKADGTVSASSDEAVLAKTVANIVDGMKKSSKAEIEAAIASGEASMEAINELGFETIDEYIDAYADEIAKEITAESLVANFPDDFNWELDGNKLYMGEDIEEAKAEGYYLVVEISKDSVTITEDNMDYFEGMIPLTFKKAD